MCQFDIPTTQQLYSVRDRGHQYIINHIILSRMQLKEQRSRIHTYFFVYYFPPPAITNN
jgi:competence protein ComGF